MLTTARFWRENAQRYRMEAGKCSSCGKVWFPPRRTCAECKGREFEAVSLPMEGKLETYTVIRTPPSAFTDEAPYAVGIVKLPGDIKVTAQIADCDLERLAIGDPVRLESAAAEAAFQASIAVEAGIAWNLTRTPGCDALYSASSASVAVRTSCSTQPGLRPATASTEISPL